MRIKYTEPLGALIDRLYKVGRMRDVMLGVDARGRPVITAVKVIRCISKQASAHIDPDMTHSQAAQIFWQIMRRFDRLQRRHAHIKEMKMAAGRYPEMRALAGLNVIDG